MANEKDSRRVLVVDDNADAADLVAQLLSLRGHQVQIATSGAAALNAAARFHPDVVFLDIGMPDIDGYQVAASMRRGAHFSSTRIVALTAWGNAKARARAAASGFDAHLVKPASVENLLDEAARTRRLH